MSDAVFDTRLDRRTLIEASAGTGKTHALAGLYMRALIVQGLRVPQILAVTYTVAATQELRARVRAHLQRAIALAASWQEGDAAAKAGEDAETALLRQLLHDALHRDRQNAGQGYADLSESLPALRMRLVRAERDLDLAAISTIHGFCQRLLAEHALDAAQTLLAGEIETRNTAVRNRLALDLWRAFGDDARDTAFLRREFGHVANLAKALNVLLAPEPLLPLALCTVEQAGHALCAAWAEVSRVFASHGAQARADIEQAISRRILSGAQDRRIDTETTWAWFEERRADVPVVTPQFLRALTPDALLAACLKNKAGDCPQSPLFAAVESFLRAYEACDLQRMHRLRTEARRRDAVRKQAFNLRDYDDLIGTVHAAIADSEVGLVLARSVRAQFPLAMVDEFQDTDARQWTIFSGLFNQGGLILVGDPKQAIYRFRGGDVHTYVQARDSADDTRSLQHNFRSRPCLLAAVQTLFEQTALPANAMGEGIAFAPVASGGKASNDDLRLGAHAAPAITFHVVPPKTQSAGQTQKGSNWNKDDSIAIAADLCADAIRDVLGSGMQRRDGDMQRVLAPRDCAVLVRTHREADAVQRALARRGVPAVASGKHSLFDGAEAREILTLLLALQASGDDRRLRAALATRLLGFDAAAIAALDQDGDGLRRWQQSFQDWRARWERHGPQALLAEVVGEHAGRLLSQLDGERYLTNLMQLAELVQQADARSLGIQGQLDWLRAAIADADPDDEAQQPRLESDAGRVQILTLHKSKGLEFPLVFLPFVGIGRSRLEPDKFAMFHWRGERVRQYGTAFAHSGAPAWGDKNIPDSAVARHIGEEREEDMRLLYVGLTRARDAVWLCCGALASGDQTALSRLFGASAPSDALLDRLDTNAVVVRELPAVPPDRLTTPPARVIPPARQAIRAIRRDWWIHSFSQLHQQRPHGVRALVDEAPADDERGAAPQQPETRESSIGGARFGGARFGNVLHHALEHADFAAWRDSDGSRVPDTQQAVLIAALRSEAFPDSEDAEALRQLAPLVARTLNAPLPEGLRLCDLPGTSRISELEFHFALRDAATSDLLALLQEHGLLRDRRDFGAWQRLSGLMTGKLDLVYRHAARLYVLDYKSNDLPAYDQATLCARMAASEYDLQALLYAVALHRWLQVRLGREYDFDRHFGGARYVFSRGLSVEEPARGIYVPVLTRSLIESTDALLAEPIRDAA